MSSIETDLLPETRRALRHRLATGQVQGRAPVGRRRRGARVVRDAAGAVSHLDLGSFVFTRQPYDPVAPVPGGVDPAGWQAG